MFKNNINYKPILLLIVFFAAFMALLWVQSTPTFMDPDSFYHLKMTKLTAEKGIILDFPWLQFTVLKDFYIDHHYLFHLAGVPFVALLGDLLGFKFYIVVLGALLTSLLYYFLKKDKIIFAEIWPLLMILDISLLFRVSLAKAAAFSLIFLFLIIYSLFDKRYKTAFLLSFFYVWSYGGFILALVMAIIYALSVAIEKIYLLQSIAEKIADLVRPRSFWFKVKLLFKNIFSWDSLKIIFPVLGGLTAGLVLNPYFPKNLNFVYQQLVEIGIKNYQQVVNVGSEWHAYEFSRLFQNSGLVIIFCLIALCISIFNYQKLKSKNIFYIICATLFLLATTKSQRYVEYFIPFAVMFCAYSFSLADWNEYKAYFRVQISFKNLYSVLLVLFLFFICAILPIIMIADLMKVQKEFIGGEQISHFQGISQYLKDNALPGQIIFHSDWDDFPALFYHNSQNYYLVGLDPTFMYNYSAELYKKFADITTAKQSDNLYSDIHGVFKCSYVIVDTGYDVLENNLIKDGHFEKVYQDSEAKIYKVK